MEHGVALGLGRDPIGHIAYRGEETCSVIGPDGAERNLDRELGAIASTTQQFQVAAHGPCRRIGSIPGPVGGVLSPQTGRHQRFDGAAQQITSVVAEYRLDPAVDQHDGSDLVDHDDAVRGRLDQIHRIELQGATSQSGVD
jgi:hypothetical protein